MGPTSMSALCLELAAGSLFILDVTWAGMASGIQNKTRVLTDVFLFSPLLYYDVKVLILVIIGYCKVII